MNLESDSDPTRKIWNENSTTFKKLAASAGFGAYFKFLALGFYLFIIIVSERILKLFKILSFTTRILIGPFRQLATVQ